MSEENQLRKRFDSFYGQQQGFLYGYACARCKSKQDGRDLLQDSLAKAWDWWVLHPDKTENDLKPVLCTIIFQTAIDKARFSKRRNHVILAGDYDAEGSTGFLENAAEEEPLSDALINHPDLAQKVRDAVESVQNRCQRELLKLYYLSEEEPTLKQVAHILNINSASVNTLHRRALQSLKKSLIAIAQEVGIITRKVSL